VPLIPGVAGAVSVEPDDLHACLLSVPLVVRR
jgi:hypothetical protein